MTTIAIDAMGTEHGISPVVDGLKQALKTKDFKAILVGNEDLIKESLKDLKDLQSKKSNIEIVHASDCIEMDSQAGSALKRKDSSIYKALELVKDGLADACISAGHSGATMSIATLKVGRIDNVSRPAICTCMPTVSTIPSIILDAGANTDCKANFLVDFAIMGYYYSKLVVGVANPRVGLLANGEEDSKGNELTKEAFGILKGHDFFKNHIFKGNVEGIDIFNGSVDVVVCDGFTGNLVLKASEGVANSIGAIIKTEIKKSPFRMLGGMILKNVFKALKNKVDYAEYGGAPLLGIKKPVIISHGKSNARAIECAIYQGIKSHEVEICNKLSEVFANLNK